MKWHIDVQLPQDIRLTPDIKIILSGSCFAGEMGEKMKISGLSCLSQPFGTLYQPHAIFKTLYLSLNQLETEEETCVENHGVWYSFDMHGSINGSSLQDLKQQITRVRNLTREFLLTPGVVVVVTFGTALGFALKDTQQKVANCHKLPASLFELQKESPAQIVSEWTSLIEGVRSLNPDSKWIFTISPVRYQKQGNVHFNKAPLFMALEELLKLDGVHYFPAYELLIDELRDYRFYAEDLLHPNRLAVDYIWEKFLYAYASEEMKAHMMDHLQFYKLIQHRPIHKQGEEYKRYMGSVVDKLQWMEQRYPDSDFNFARSQLLKEMHESS